MENPQLMAEKRAFVPKQSLEHLGGRFEDVIFIGDMNWNDSKDGLCPIVAPWKTMVETFDRSQTGAATTKETRCYGVQNACSDRSLHQIEKL